MSIIFVLLALSLLIAVAFLLAFLWSTKSGQFDDAEGPGIRMLQDTNKSTNSF